MILSKVFPEVQRCTYNCYVQRVVGETYNTCTTLYCTRTYLRMYCTCISISDGLRRPEVTRVKLLIGSCDEKYPFSIF